MNTTQRIAEQYGVQESNGLADGHQYHRGVDYADQLSLADVKARGGRITRLRILAEQGRYDVSYIHATLADGAVVPVYVNMRDGGMCLPARLFKGYLIEWAKEEGVFAKGIGLLDEANWSILRG